MTEKTKIEIEPFEVDQRINANSRYYAGKAGSVFYISLRDEKKILGATCESCDITYYPPRTTCGKCFGVIDENKMTELGPQGTLETFTRVTYSEPIHPKEAPYIYGIIKLDGASTGMAHFIDEVDEDKLEIGMRLEPVFLEDRNGNILDIKYFKPVTEQS